MTQGLMGTERLESSELGATTHQDLSRMLGVRRSSATVAMHVLEGELRCARDGAGARSWTGRGCRS